MQDLRLSIRRYIESCMGMIKDNEGIKMSILKSRQVPQCSSKVSHLLQWHRKTNSGSRQLALIPERRAVCLFAGTCRIYSLAYPFSHADRSNQIASRVIFLQSWDLAGLNCGRIDPVFRTLQKRISKE